MYDDMRVEHNIMVPMRDGIKLACDVYCSAAAGQTVPGAFPVILERTPYGKGQTSRSEISRRHPERPTSRQEVAAFFVHHGYVVVYQDLSLSRLNHRLPRGKPNPA
jgi:predicted acyl esterase